MVKDGRLFYGRAGVIFSALAVKKPLSPQWGREGRGVCGIP